MDLDPERLLDPGPQEPGRAADGAVPKEILPDSAPGRAAERVVRKEILRD